MQATETKKLNILRYGMMAIPPLAWAVGFAPLFMISNGSGGNWVSDALVPSLVEAVIVGAVCLIVYTAYRQAEKKA